VLHQRALVQLGVDREHPAYRTRQADEVGRIVGVDDLEVLALDSLQVLR
jgi:hypothetical protein